MTPNPATITFEQVADLRDKTERLSTFLASRLKVHLATLYPILAPHRVFGKYLGAKDAAPRADEAYSQLQAQYKDVAGAPFDLKPELDESAMSAMENGAEIYPWEYTVTAKDRVLTISSPVRWVLTYRSEYSLAELRRLVAAGERRKGVVQRFVVNSLAMQIVIARNPNVAELLHDLRYDLKVEPGPGLGKLPLLTIGPRVSSFRPPDDLLLATTRFSGVAAFVELVDPQSVKEFPDSLRDQLVKIITA